MAILPLLLLAFAPADPALPSIDEWVHDWEISRDFTLAVAQKMPAELYTFRATPEEMEFGRMTLHIANAILYRFEQVSGVKPDVNTKVTAKDDILRAPKQSYA